MLIGSATIALLVHGVVIAGIAYLAHVYRGPSINFKFGRTDQATVLSERNSPAVATPHPLVFPDAQLAGDSSSGQEPTEDSPSALTGMQTVVPAPNDSRQSIGLPHSTEDSPAPRFHR